MQRTGLVLTPLDVLFFRDGRPFEAAMSARSGLPMPQTFAGAMRTWLLRALECDFEKLKTAVKGGKSFAEALAEQSPDMRAVADLRFRGPWFALKREEGDIEPLLPAPATLLKEEENEEERFVRFAPLREGEDVPGWSPPVEGMRPLWHRTKRPLELAGGYLTLRGMQKFLEGRLPEESEHVVGGELFERDRRVGIGVAPDTLTAQEGLIYGIEMIALKENVVLYAEVSGLSSSDLPSEAAVVPFGGEGKRVLVEPATPIEWPGAPPDEGRSMLVLTSPAFFDPREPWCPQKVREALVAAAVPGYEAVSGWDLARGGPKPTRFGVSAGSVYFLKRPLDSSVTSLCEDDEDAAVGWGTFVQGSWSYA